MIVDVRVLQISPKFLIDGSSREGECLFLECLITVKSLLRMHNKNLDQVTIIIWFPSLVRYWTFVGAGVDAIVGLSCLVLGSAISFILDV